MIIFQGDWVKFAGRWGQVVDIEANDMVQLSRKNDFDEPMWVNANSMLIERVLSDSEMQAILETV